MFVDSSQSSFLARFSFCRPTCRAEASLWVWRKWHPWPGLLFFEEDTASLFPLSFPSGPTHKEPWCTCSPFRGEGEQEQFFLPFCPCLWQAQPRPICSLLRFSPPLIFLFLLDFTHSRRTEWLPATPPQLSTSLAPPFVSSNIKLTESLKMLSFLFESPLLNFLVTQIFVIL